MRRLVAVGASLVLIVAACTGGDASTQAPDLEGPFAGTVAAPEFPADLAWLNTGGEQLSLEALRGKIVALHFWSASCVICSHVEPDLERLRVEFAESLVVVGVHSPRFENETPTEAVRQAVMRLGIGHPVVNDPSLAVWQAWEGEAQPTVALVDPAGNAVGVRPGEGVYDGLRPVIAGLAQEFADQIERSRLDYPTEAEGALPTVLSYPSGIAVTATHDRAYIADTGNHRVVAAALPSGDVVAVYGGGTDALVDGTGVEAMFSSPRGLALSADESTLYVADSGNHAIRAVDITTGEVATVGGTGALGPWPPEGGPARDTALRTPWDVAATSDTLYVAMAGSHQLWAIDLSGSDARPIAGTGAEGIADGAADEAELARPSSLAIDPTGELLYFTDPESSTVRSLDLVDKEVRTIAGDSSALFVHGDTDGSGAHARLQVPGGVSFTAERLFVADSYNHKIKAVTDTGEVATILGGGSGWRDGADPRFYEPTAIDVVSDTLYVADTNNHALRITDLVTGDTTTLVLGGIEVFQPSADDEDYRGTIVELDPVEVATGEGTVVLDITLPPDHKVNEDAPSSIEWVVDGDVAAFPADLDPSLTGVTFPVAYPVTFVDGSGTVTADINLFWCANDAESLCFIEQLRLRVPVTAGAAGSNEIRLPHEVTLPEIPS